MSQVIPTSSTTNASDASVASMLERIDRRLARLESAAARLEALDRSLPGAVAGAVDTFDEIVDRLRARGVDVDERLRLFADMLDRLTAPQTQRAVSMLLDQIGIVEHLVGSEVFAERSVDVIAKVGHALSEARAEATPGVGLWGAARATSDEDVRRAVGFLLRFAQLFGRSLSAPHEGTPRLPAKGDAP